MDAIRAAFFSHAVEKKPQGNSPSEYIVSDSAIGAAGWRAGFDRFDPAVFLLLFCAESESPGGFSGERSHLT
jgi:hypothetical protein